MVYFVFHTPLLGNCLAGWTYFIRTIHADDRLLRFDCRSYACEKSEPEKAGKRDNTSRTTVSDDGIDLLAWLIPDVDGSFRWLGVTQFSRGKRLSWLCVGVETECVLSAQSTTKSDNKWITNEVYNPDVIKHKIHVWKLKKEKVEYHTALCCGSEPLVWTCDMLQSITLCWVRSTSLVGAHLVYAEHLSTIPWRTFRSYGRMKEATWRSAGNMRTCNEMYSRLRWSRCIMSSWLGTGRSVNQWVVDTKGCDN